jgi:hypothetical protein
MGLPERLRSNPARKSARAPDFHLVVEERERDGAACDRVVATDERFDQNLAHRLGRNERPIDTLVASALDSPREREVPLAKELGLLE